MTEYFLCKYRAFSSYFEMLKLLLHETTYIVIGSNWKTATHSGATLLNLGN